jgi:hypothetical protein
MLIVIISACLPDVVAHGISISARQNRKSKGGCCENATSNGAQTSKNCDAYGDDTFSQSNKSRPDLNMTHADNKDCGDDRNPAAIGP